MATCSTSIFRSFSHFPLLRTGWGILSLRSSNPLLISPCRWRSLALASRRRYLDMQTVTGFGFGPRRFLSPRLRAPFSVVLTQSSISILSQGESLITCALVGDQERTVTSSPPTHGWCHLCWVRRYRSPSTFISPRKSAKSGRCD